MTKTLTEQWKDGELTGGLYYIKMKDGRIFTDRTSYVVGEKMYRWEMVDYHYVAEVLESVPSFDGYKELLRLPAKYIMLEAENKALHTTNNKICKEKNRLAKQLEVAIKGLKEIDSPTGVASMAYRVLLEINRIGPNGIRGG